MADKKIVYEVEITTKDDSKEVVDSLKKVDKQYEKLKQSNKEYNKELETEKIKLQLLATSRKKSIRDAIKLGNETQELVILQKKEVLSEQELIRMNNLLVAKRKRMVVVTKSERKEYNSLTVAIAKNNRTLIKSDKNIGRFQRSVGKYSNALKGFAGSLGLAGLAMASVQLLKSSTEAYKEQMVAVTKLTTVMKQRTNASDDEVQSILDLTAAQQEQGVIGDEVQLAGAQQLATFLDQTDSLESLIPAMNDLLAQQKGLNASQGDGVNIGNLFGKVMQGQVGALSKVGITFSEAEEKILKYGNESERAATLSAVITNNVGEMNKSLAATDLGQIKNAENILGDMSEELGKRLIPSIAKWKNGLVSVFGALLNITKVKMADQLKEEEKEVNKLTTSLTNSNLPLDERKNILLKLKNINPDIVEGLDAENFSYKQLKINVDEYNKSMVTRILMANLGEEQEEKLATATNNKAKAMQKEYDISKLILDNNEELAYSNISLEEKVVSLLKEMGSKEKQDFKSLKTIKLLQKASKDLITLREEEKIAMSDVDAFEIQIDAMKKVLGITEELNKEKKKGGDEEEICDAKCQEEKRKKNEIARKKAEEQELKDSQNLIKEKIKALEVELERKKLIRDSDYSDITSLNEQELQDYIKLYSELSTLEQILATEKFELVKLSNKDKTKLTETQEQDLQNKITKIQQDALKTRATLKLQDLDKEYRDKFAKLFELKEKEDNLLTQTAAQRTTYLEQNSAEELNILNEKYDNEVLALQEKLGKDYLLNQEYIDIIKIMDEEKADAEILLVEDTEKKKVDITKKANEEKRKNTQDFFSAITKMLELWDNIDNAKKSAELKRAGDNEEKIAAIEEKYAEKKKQRAIASILVDTAMAIMGVWAQNPNPIYGGIMTALLAGISIAQVSAVNSQPTSFAQGGKIEGKKHSNGGIMYGGYEIEGDEYIVNRVSTNYYEPLLDKINDAGNGSGNNATVDKFEMIDYDRMGAIFNNIKTYVTTKDINEGLDDDNRIKVQQTL